MRNFPAHGVCWANLAESDVCRENPACNCFGFLAYARDPLLAAMDRLPLEIEANTNPLSSVRCFCCTRSFVLPSRRSHVAGGASALPAVRVGAVLCGHTAANPSRALPRATPRQPELLFQALDTLLVFRRGLCELSGAPADIDRSYATGEKQAPIVRTVSTFSRAI